MRVDVRNFLKRFVVSLRQDKLKAGDLLLTAEVHRVMTPYFQGENNSVLVNNVLPECKVCKSAGREECSHMRVMHIDMNGGQQMLMQLKPVPEQHHVDLDIEDFFTGSDSFVDRDVQDRIMQEIEEYVWEECQKEGFNFSPSTMSYKARIVVDLIPRE